MKIWQIIVILLLGSLIGSGGTYLMQTHATPMASPQPRYSRPRHTKHTERRVFLNASMHPTGNTSALAKQVFGQQPYRQINLADYHIPQLGQGTGDFDQVYAQLKGAEVIVIGTPVYWSNMSGYLKTFIDHLQIDNALKGADLYLIVQGSDPQQPVAVNSTYGTFARIAKRLGLHLVGIATNTQQAHQLYQKMLGH